MSAKKYDDLINCLKSLKRERELLSSYSEKSGKLDLTQARRDVASNLARMCAIEVRCLEHEAHCLAVELGIADMRSKEHYEDSRAPAGFNREFLIKRRKPEVS